MGVEREASFILRFFSFQFIQSLPFPALPPPPPFRFLGQNPACVVVKSFISCTRSNSRNGHGRGPREEGGRRTSRGRGWQPSRRLPVVDEAAARGRRRRRRRRAYNDAFAVHELLRECERDFRRERWRSYREKETRNTKSNAAPLACFFLFSFLSPT